MAELQYVVSHTSGATLTLSPAATSAGSTLIVAAVIANRFGGATATPNMWDASYTMPMGNNVNMYTLQVWVRFNAPSGITSVVIDGNGQTIADAFIYEFSDVTAALDGAPSGGSTGAVVATNLTLLGTGSSTTTFAFIIGANQLSSGSAGSAITNIADTNSLSWSGVSGVAHSFTTSNISVASTWENATAAVGDVTLTAGSTPEYRAGLLIFLTNGIVQGFAPRWVSV